MNEEVGTKSCFWNTLKGGSNEQNVCQISFLFVK